VKRDEIIGGIILFIFGGITALLSLRMPIGTFRAAGTGLFPLLLGIFLMILSGVFLLNLSWQKKKEPGEKEFKKEIPGSTKNIILFLGAMASATLFLNPLGYPLISFLLMVALLRILGTRRWTTNIFLSLVTAAASYLLFVGWLKIPLPKGWIGI
jgi:putative tricarboxylic transport membrane protein